MKKCNCNKLPNHQIDIIDEIFLNPKKKPKNKKSIPASQVFEGIKTNKKIILPKTFEERLKELQTKRIIKPKK